VRVAAATVRRLESFREEFGVDPGFQQVGYLFLASEPGTERLFRRAVELQARLGCPSRFLSPLAIAGLVPGLRTADLRGGAFCPSDGHLDPASLVAGFAGAARARGVRLLAGSPVTAVERSGSRVRAVRTAAGERVSCRVAVNAMGAWAPGLARSYGADLPITPWRAQCFRLEGFPPLADPLPMVIDFDGGKTYFHGDGDGIVAGMDAESRPVAAGDLTCDWSRVTELAERLAQRAPVLGEARVTHGWAGLLELTPDENPIVGWTHFDNLYTAAGFSGHGMSLAPGLAPEAAREVLGMKSSLDLAPYRPDRFEAPSRAGEALSMR
jgi:sarcosine oxidase, subunit beta